VLFVRCLRRAARNRAGGLTDLGDLGSSPEPRGWLGDLQVCGQPAWPVRTVNLLLNPRQLRVFRLALFGEGNVNAAIMIQLSRPYRRAVPAAGASRSRETPSAITDAARGLGNPAASEWPPLILVISP